MNAYVNSINNFGETPLHLACATGHKGVIERLLLARASTNLRDINEGNTPLHVLA
jgi:ankyrin repeat protein